MQLIIEKEAEKGLAKMSEKTRVALLNRLKAIAANPRGKHPNVKPLTGYRDMYRLRQGDWRAIYHLIWTHDQMRLVFVDVRGSVYR
jgi:mRNA interferase RelE/StbE